MPTIIRFVMTLAVIAVLVGAAMFYLANFVEPGVREMSARIPADRIDPVPIMPLAQPPAAQAPDPEPAPETAPSAE